MAKSRICIAVKLYGKIFTSVKVIQNISADQRIVHVLLTNLEMCLLCTKHVDKGVVTLLSVTTDQCPESPGILRMPPALFIRPGPGGFRGRQAWPNFAGLVLGFGNSSIIGKFSPRSTKLSLNHVRSCQEIMQRVSRQISVQVCSISQNESDVPKIS